MRDARSDESEQYCKGEPETDFSTPTSSLNIYLVSDASTSTSTSSSADYLSFLPLPPNLFYPPSAYPQCPAQLLDLG